MVVFNPMDAMYDVNGESEDKTRDSWKPLRDENAERLQNSIISKAYLPTEVYQSRSVSRSCFEISIFGET